MSTDARRIVDPASEGTLTEGLIALNHEVGGKVQLGTAPYQSAGTAGQGPVLFELQPHLAVAGARVDGSGHAGKAERVALAQVHEVNPVGLLQ